MANRRNYENHNPVKVSKPDFSLVLTNIKREYDYPRHDTGRPELGPLNHQPGVSEPGPAPGPAPGPQGPPGAYGGRRLNIEDALSYLDTVKSQFQDNPDVYNNFLDIMKEFNTQKIDTPGVIERVSTLFKGHTLLVEGFNTFLPPGYSIVCSSDPNDPNPIRVTTPNGTITTGLDRGSPQRFTNFQSQPAPQPQFKYPYEEVLESPKADSTVPVEMDDAIGYVNKIKVRFTNEPYIYKTFLDLLQTYRREQRPILEVYQQVAVLFRGAPDLLADFKKFLPDPDNLENSDMQEYLPPAHQNQYEQLPPYGNFQPPAHRPFVQDEVASYEYRVSSERDEPAAVAPAAHSHPIAYTSGPVEVATNPLDETLNHFERIKKHIANKINYGNFVKLLNLFSNNILDKRMLVERVEYYIGDSYELFTWFKKYVNFKDLPLSIENIEFKKHRLELGLCKRYGASYRQIPKSDTYMPCSGRDQMCWEVLNDEWVSHPTWDSEESGYIAHRKNQYEDNLYRIEEERHEYDYYMENNLRTIQTLEVIAAHLMDMSEEEKVNFRLQEGLGHTSKTIYKSIIRKIYGKEKGFKVVDALYEKPYIAVPLVLKRLKQKDEEWKKSHLEWCKFWREQELKLFYKSLDHIGLTFKQTDKKLLTTKQLISEISSVKVEQSTKRIIPLAPKAQEQLEYDFKDKEILVDISKLVVAFLNYSTYSSNDKLKLNGFFNSFLGLFFSLPQDIVALLPKLQVSDKNDEEELGQRSPKKVVVDDRKRHRETDLLRDVLRKNKRLNTGKKELEKEDKEEQLELNNEISRAEESWIQTLSKDQLETIAKPDDQLVQNGTKRSIYNLFGNTTIYVFFRYLRTIYERLLELKQMNKEVELEINSRRDVNFAKDLDLLAHQLEEMGIQITGDNSYRQVLELSTRLIEGEIEHQWFEETLRQAYRNRGFKLFTIDKVVQGLIKHMHNITSDHKTSEIMVLFEHDRNMHHTTTRNQIIYRMKVRTLMNPEENMFRVEYNEADDRAVVQFVALDDLTLKDKRSPDEQWNYYLTSYFMSHPTEGVPLSKISFPFLKSSITEDSIENDNIDGYVSNQLQLQVSKLDYKMSFSRDSHDEYTRYSVYTNPVDDKAAKSKLDKQERLRGVVDGEFGWKNQLDEADIQAGEDKLKSVLQAHLN